MKLFWYEKAALIWQVALTIFSLYTGYFSPDVQIGILYGYFALIIMRLVYFIGKNTNGE